MVLRCSHKYGLGVLSGIWMCSFLLFGGFHEYISCALSIALCVYLWFTIRKNGKLILKKDILSWSVFAICIGYGLTCLWGIDRGMSFVGFLKFLPVGLYLVCLWQDGKQQAFLRIMPLFGAGCAVVCSILAYMPATAEFFAVAGRAAGFFQYPNTFAIFLLVCQLLLFRFPDKKWWDYVAILLLVAGILLTGSRTVFVLMVIANGIIVFLSAGRKTRFWLLGALVAACLAVVLLALGGNPVLSRYLSISFTQSTFIGRLLYAADGLKLVLRYPLGMGYMGYYYTQSSIQTGVYSVAFAHNELLQLFLDVGWLPAGLFAAVVIKWFFRKDITWQDRIIVGTLCAHCLFDFDLQFVAMFMLLLVLLDSPAKTVEIRKVKALYAPVGVTALVSAYMCAALLLAYLGHWQTADKLYPYNTANLLNMLSKTEDVTYANELSDRILAQNKAYFAPYSMKAKYAFSRGNIPEVINYKHKVFEANPFGWEEYEEYCQMLIQCIALYQKNGDMQSVQACYSELIATQKRLRGNEQKLSALGKMIDDVPVTELSQAVQAYIAERGRSQ